MKKHTTGFTADLTFTVINVKTFIMYLSYVRYTYAKFGSNCDRNLNIIICSRKMTKLVSFPYQTEIPL